MPDFFMIQCHLRKPVVFMLITGYNIMTCGNHMCSIFSNDRPVLTLVTLYIIYAMLYPEEILGTLVSAGGLEGSLAQ